jgi:hypothetical protein
MLRLCARIGLSILLLIWIGALPSYAADEDLLRRTNEACGFDQAIESIHREFVKSVTNIPGNPPAQIMEAIKAISDRSFDAGRIIRNSESEILKQGGNADLAAVEKHCTSPFGRRIVELEVASAAHPDFEAAQQQGNAIFAQLPMKDGERLDLYRRIVESQSQIDLTESMSLNMAYSMLAAVAASRQVPLSNQQITDLMRGVSAGMRERLEKTIYAGMAFTYRDLPVSDLRKYVEFLETEPARAYYDNMLRALDKALSFESREFGNQLMTELGLRKA